MTDKTSDLVERFAALVGAANVIAGEYVDETYRRDLTGGIHAAPLCLVRPASTSEVSAVLKLASTLGVPVTTQGGMTGAVMGGIASQNSIILSLERMNQIEEIDAVARAVTVQAGTVLQTIQEAAETAGLFLPLDIGSRGSATIGGVVSTNAGGTRALRWGVAREMVLGLEVVLADGTILHGLKKVLKDNAGYDWKHLLIGSEGTLGVVTRAVLRLRQMPRSTVTALVALDTFEAVLALLWRLERDLGGQLSSFEAMWRGFYEVVTEGNRKKRSPPLPAGYNFYVLAEMMGGDAETDHDRFEKVLAESIADGEALAVVIARSIAQRDGIWAVREDIADPMKSNKLAFGYDVSVGLSAMEAVVTRVQAGIRSHYPDALILVYGHLGDSNLHFVVGVGDASEAAEHVVDDAVYAVIGQEYGSISAEHGIGTLKRAYLHYSRSPEEIALMRTLKVALDPRNILNPGKVMSSQ